MGDAIDARREAAALAQRLGEGSGNAYALALRLSTLGMGHAEEHESLWGLWLLWGDLTDSWEAAADASAEQRDVEALMVDAAREYSQAVVGGDDDELQAYFDRWFRERLGHPRWEPPKQTGLP